LEKILGEGSFATVKLATETTTNLSFAVKILDKAQIIKKNKRSKKKKSEK